MTTDAVVGLVLLVVCSLRQLLSVSNTCSAFLCPSQPFIAVYRRDPHTHVATTPKILVILSKMPMLSDADYAHSPNRRSPTHRDTTLHT